MQINPTYFQVDELIEDLLAHKVKNYDKDRNYVYFADAFKNVSGLSAFISRGLLKEKQLLKKTLKSDIVNEKFIQEIFWRVYWQGWLENFSEIWSNYKIQISQIEKKEFKYNKNYLQALAGNTDIKPFDEWVYILKKDGYLHNHVRMWFASIWIHYLGIPWQLGQKFFYENLLDGDVSSNLLSWRWVAGVQTQGKKYIVTEHNINKFTLNRYKGLKLPNVVNNFIPPEERKKNEIKYSVLEKQYKKCALFIFENNLSSELLEKLRKNINVIVFIKFNITAVEKSNVVLSFQNQLSKEFIKKNLNIENKYFEIILPQESIKLINLIKSYKIENIVLEYLRIGYEKDIFMNWVLDLNKDIKINYILDSFYANSWQYCQKGFFKFKEKIPLLTKELR